MDRGEIEFEFERAAKNTYRFREKSVGSPIIGTLYVQKPLFGAKERKNGSSSEGKGKLEGVK